MVGLGFIAAGLAAAALSPASLLLPLQPPTIEGFIARYELNGGSTAACAVLAGVGSFLVFLALSRVLPEGRPWIVVGASLSLLVALVNGAFMFVNSFVIYPIALTGTPPSGAVLSFYTAMSVAAAVTAIGGTLGGFLGLWGIVRGIFGRRRPQVPPAAS